MPQLTAVCCVCQYSRESKSKKYQPKNRFRFDSIFNKEFDSDLWFDNRNITMQFTWKCHSCTPLYHHLIFQKTASNLEVSVIRQRLVLDPPHLLHLVEFGLPLPQDACHLVCISILHPLCQRHEVLVPDAQTVFNWRQWPLPGARFSKKS